MFKFVVKLNQYAKQNNTLENEIKCIQGTTTCSCPTHHLVNMCKCVTEINVHLAYIQNHFTWPTSKTTSLGLHPKPLHLAYIQNHLSVLKDKQNAHALINL